MQLGHTPSVPTRAVADELAPSSTLEDAVETYLAEVRRFRAPKTIAACERILHLFGSPYPTMRIEDVSRKILLDHMSFLKSEGLADRTIYNHTMRIGTLLKANGIVGLLAAADKPKYDEKEVEAYEPGQLTTLFAAASSEEKELFQFFLNTGLREQEVMYTSWKNIDFQGKVVKVRSKPEMGFRIKDKEERSVPVPDTLIFSLLKRKQKSTSILVFPGPNGKPNGHFLRILKGLAFRAGLNCGECQNSNGQSCVSKPICSEWGCTNSGRPLLPCTTKVELRSRPLGCGWAIPTWPPPCNISRRPTYGRSGPESRSTPASPSSMLRVRHEPSESTSPCPYRARPVSSLA